MPLLIFALLCRLEPLSFEKKVMWRREMKWFLCVSDHNVELVPSWQTFPDGSKLEDQSYYTSRSDRILLEKAEVVFSEMRKYGISSNLKFLCRVVNLGCVSSLDCKFSRKPYQVFEVVPTTVHGLLLDDQMGVSTDIGVMP